MWNALFMLRWVKYLIVSAERLVRSSAQYTLCYYFATALVVVAVFSVSLVSLRLPALVRFMAKLLAVVVLSRL
jgi:hypothetical protein